MGWFAPAPAPEPPTRLVRLHVEGLHELEDGTVTAGTLTIEGYMRGHQPVAGHYILDRPKVLQTANESTAIHGAEIPAGRVIFVEVLKVDGQP